MNKENNRRQETVSGMYPSLEGKEKKLNHLCLVYYIQNEHSRDRNPNLFPLCCQWQNWWQVKKSDSQVLVATLF
jgi:hypothetical protein